MCGTCQHQLAKRKRKRGQSGRKKAEPTGNNFYATKEWARLRYMAFEKYGTQCAVCGGDKSHGVRLTVDHIKPVKKYPELALDINNLQVLCTLCNRGKGASFETDWRNLDAEYRDIIGD
jgi:5-methylcytosine-specific restriction endonuclease McrA